ncbi:MAG: hypothetical protein DRP13_04375 [Candidatus Aenigmatarchaeota archaeon]|nr:MAG: hypothetical protein DRP13_04375 [Candidatus Aenigmarchaeota archaeon]
MRKKTFILSLIVSAFLLFYINIYNVPRQIGITHAEFKPPQNMNLDSMLSFSLTLVIEYIIILLAVYLFFRAIIKTFEKQFKRGGR